MASLEKYVQKIHKKLNNERLEEHKVIKYLKELDQLQITLDILKATGIGRAVNRYRKHPSGIGELASSLVIKWKDLLKQESSSAKQCSPSRGENKGIFHLNSNSTNHIPSDDIGRTPLVNEPEVHQMNNKHVKSREKTSETKSKVRSAPQLCDVSFGCEPVIEKPKKRPISSASASLSPSIKLTPSDIVKSGPGLPPLPSSLSVHNSLLPEIQPTYKPIRMPEFGLDTSPKKKKGIIGNELDANALTSRKSRTQVFSGRKLTSAGKVEIPSLFELAMKVLIENIDALDDTGGVPFDILQPVLERCNPQQLLHLEECNPYFLDDTEPLWETLCFKDFRGTQPQHNQSWRELYLKNEQEKEVRLKKIHEKITANQRAKKPERQVKLAYVMTEAKPPREVRRKQAKFGTGSGIHPSGPPVAVAVPSRGSAQANHRTLNSAPSKKQAVPAPMMKKTMQLFKNQRSRAHTSIRRT